MQELSDYRPNAMRSKPSVSFTATAADREWLERTAGEFGINRSALLQRMILFFRLSPPEFENLRAMEDAM